MYQQIQELEKRQMESKVKKVEFLTQMHEKERSLQNIQTAYLQHSPSRSSTPRSTRTSSSSPIRTTPLASISFQSPSHQGSKYKPGGEKSSLPSSSYGLKYPLTSTPNPYVKDL